MREVIYNPSDDPLRRLNVALMQCLYRIPHQKTVRLMIVSKLTRHTIERSTKEVPLQKICAILDLYFPDWRLPVTNRLPEKSQILFRQMGQEFSDLLVVQKEADNG